MYICDTQLRKIHSLFHIYHAIQKHLKKINGQELINEEKLLLKIMSYSMYIIYSYKININLKNYLLQLQEKEIYSFPSLVVRSCSLFQQPTVNPSIAF